MLPPSVRNCWRSFKKRKRNWPNAETNIVAAAARRIPVLRGHPVLRGRHGRPGPPGAPLPRELLGTRGPHEALAPGQNRLGGGVRSVTPGSMRQRKGPSVVSPQLPEAVYPGLLGLHPRSNPRSYHRPRRRPFQRSNIRRPPLPSCAAGTVGSDRRRCARNPAVS